jgi:hypothetical protein
MLRVLWDDYTDRCAAALEKFLDDLDTAREELGVNA